MLASWMHLSKNPVPAKLRGEHAAMAIWFVFLLWANVETPRWADDYCRTIHGGFSNYIAATWSEYFTWTGRFFVSAITYFVMSTGPVASFLWFDIANSLVFLGLVALVLRLSRAASGDRAYTQRSFYTGFLDTCLVALLLFWVSRTIGEVAIWKTGSIGYLWAIAGELLVVCQMLPDSQKNRVWLLPFAFLVATFLEPLSVLTSVLLALVAAVYWRKGVTKPAAVALAHLAGTVFLLAAPGNFRRAVEVQHSTIFEQMWGIVATFGSLFDGYWIVAIAITAWPFVAPMLFRRSQHAEVVSDSEQGWSILKAGHGWLFVVLTFAYMFVLFPLPRSTLSSRVAWPASVFLVCYLASIWQLRPISLRRERRTALLLVGLFALQCVVVIPSLLQLAQIAENWRTATEPQIEQDAVLPSVRVDGKLVLTRKFKFFIGLSENPDYYVNVCYARAMGLKTVTAR